MDDANLLQVLAGSWVSVSVFDINLQFCQTRNHDNGNVTTDVAKLTFKLLSSLPLMVVFVPIGLTSIWSCFPKAILVVMSPPREATDNGIMKQ